jgi:hypothetical protein
VRVIIGHAETPGAPEADCTASARPSPELFAERPANVARAEPREGAAVPDGVGTTPDHVELVLVLVEAVALHIRVEEVLVGPKASKGFQQGVNILIELVHVGREIEPVDGEEVLVGVIPLLVEPELFHVAAVPALVGVELVRVGGKPERVGRELVGVARELN